MYPNSMYNRSLRRHFILAYAESILSDPSLWRMAIEYMVTCDEIGLQTAREVLLHVPLRVLEPAPKAISASDIAASPRSHLEDLLEVCDEHDFLDTKANICRVSDILPHCMIV
jgi:nuclear pore complex protein Nup85